MLPVHLSTRLLVACKSLESKKKKKKGFPHWEITWSHVGVWMDLYELRLTTWRCSLACRRSFTSSTEFETLSKLREYLEKYAQVWQAYDWAMTTIQPVCDSMQMHDFYSPSEDFLLIVSDFAFYWALHIMRSKIIYNQKNEYECNFRPICAKCWINKLCNVKIGQSTLVTAFSRIGRVNFIKFQFAHCSNWSL